MTTGLDVFDITIEKTNKILIGIEDEFGWQGRRHQSYAALRSVLHTLRDRLRVDDAVNFSAQLPLLVKGVFFDEYKPEATPIKMHREEFVQHVARSFPFSVDGGPEALIKIVLSHVFESINPEEAKKILSMMPKDVSDLLEL